MAGGAPQSAAIGSAYATLLQASVTDVFGNPIPNVPVTFTVPAAGASGHFNALATVPTNALGVATAPVLIANHEQGSFTVTAAVAGVAVADDFDLSNTVVPSAVSVLAGWAQKAVVGKAYPQPLEARVTDASGQPVSGIAVDFEQPGSGPAAASLPATVFTNANGVATAPLTANDVAGSFTVDAWVAGVDRPAAFSLTSIAAAPQSITIVAGEASSAGNPLTTDMAVLVVDAFNNPISGASVTFTVVSTAGGPAPTFAGGKTVAVVKTNRHGVATAPALTANAKNKLYGAPFTVVAAVAGLAETATLTIGSSWSIV